MASVRAWIFKCTGRLPSVSCRNRSRGGVIEGGQRLATSIEEYRGCSERYQSISKCIEGVRKISRGIEDDRRVSRGVERYRVVIEGVRTISKVP